MLILLLLLISSLISLKFKNIARWLALISLMLFKFTFTFEWLPGVIFVWKPLEPLVLGAFLLIIATSLFYSKRLSNAQMSSLLLFTCGLLGFIGSSSAFQVFFFLELMTFPLFYLIREEDPVAAFKFLGFSQISSILVLAGILGKGLLASSLLTLGFAIKMGLFPFHSWLTEVLSESPPPISALISTASVMCGAYGIFLFSTTPLLIFPLGIISAIFGALSASVQEELKKLLAFSTISQMGITTFLLCFSPLSFPLFLTVYSISKATLFFSAEEIIEKTNRLRIQDIRIKSFTLFIAITLASLSLLGVFPLLGFFTQVGILNSSLMFSRLTGIFVLVSLIPTTFYIEKLLSMFAGEGDERLEAIVPLLLSSILLIGGLIWIF